MSEMYGIAERALTVLPVRENALVLAAPAPKALSFLARYVLAIAMRRIEDVQAQVEFDDLLEAVARGESIVIMRGGKDIARLTPEPDEPAEPPSAGNSPAS